jgi:serine/threonine protein kinase
VTPLEQSLSPVDDDVAGTRFGRYRLLRRIGSGGMAEAFLAVMEGQKGFRRKCVVKRIRPDKAASSYYAQMFVDEARITAALHHPNIVQVYEFGEVGNLLFLTMEHVDGRNLGAVLDSLHARKGLMPIAMAAHVVQQVARGLDYAHKLTGDDGAPLGVIHRDVSPTNVMLLRTGEVKLLDFGVAKAERALKQGATVVGKVKGKLAYMAPEQHSGKAVDLRADVFATGVMLWEMLTGQLLFAGAKGGERSRRLMRGEVPAPSSLRTKVPPVLDAIVLRCLQVQPADRYPSAGALAAELGAFVRAAQFDPAELAALVNEYAGDEPGEALESDSTPAAPIAIDSHAILTREDDRHVPTDHELMAATTARERMRPVILRPTPARGATPITLSVQPEPVEPPAARRPSARRAWAVAIAVAAAGALALFAVTRPASTSAVTSSASRHPGAEITPVPAPPPVPEPEPPAPPVVRPPERSTADVRPTKPVTHRRPRAETKVEGPSGELRLANPF